MPALKVRLPHIDRPFLPAGPVSLAAKTRLTELLAVADAPTRIPPPSQPAELFTLWVSDEQIHLLETIAATREVESAGVAASSLLHAHARELAAIAALTVTVAIPPARADAAPLAVGPLDAAPAPVASSSDAGAASAPAPPAASDKPRKPSKPKKAERKADAAPRKTLAPAPKPASAAASAPRPSYVAMPAAPPRGTLDAINLALGNATRPDQAQFYQTLVREVLGRTVSHEVVFAEAATGIGKSRAFEALAVDWVEVKSDPVVAIAAPSYSVLLQSIVQWQRIAQVYPAPLSAVVVGQQEFVSAGALSRVLQEHPDTPGAAAAKAWLDAGGHAPPDDPFGHRWLIRSLRAVSDGAWTLDAQVQLDSDVPDDDLGRVAYRAQFEAAREAQVIFCTHAMLATEVRRVSMAAAKAYNAEDAGGAGKAGWQAWGELSKEAQAGRRAHELRNEILGGHVDGEAGRLPPIGLLIVDEAHLLEQSFASVFSSGIALSRLHRTLRSLREAVPKAVTADDLARLDDAWQQLRGLGESAGADRAVTTDNGTVREAAATIRAVVTAVLGRVPKKALNRPEIRHLQGVRTTLDVAASASGESTGLSVRVTWSPSVHWPSIDVGRYDVSRELDFLWSVFVGRSVLVSATLFDEVSEAGFENMRLVLSVRSAMARPLPPIRPGWLYDPVTLHLVQDKPHPDGIPRFRRPTSRDGLSPEDAALRSDRWRNDVAAYIAGVHGTGKGGLLTLMTAHAEREEVCERLRALLPEPDLLIEHAPGVTLEACRHQFYTLTAAGRRPLLIAVGAAWTGLDLSSDGLFAITGEHLDDEADHVLTDLVIPTIPLGTNRSLTHEWRRQRRGMMVEVGATAIMVRQGVGRLIRRPGLLPIRRLHILDNRLNETAWNPLMHPIRRILSAYTRRVGV